MHDFLPQFRILVDDLTRATADDLSRIRDTPPQDLQQLIAAGESRHWARPRAEVPIRSRGLAP